MPHGTGRQCLKVYNRILATTERTFAVTICKNIDILNK